MTVAATALRTFVALIADMSVMVTATEVNGRKVTVASEARPASLADADTFLAAHSFRRTAPWDLVGGMVGAPVETIDNVFDGTVAARLWEAVGTTHEPFEVMSARAARDGDLISDLEISEVYVVAAWRYELDVMRIHMVGEGRTWDERYTTDFPADQLVQVARQR
jgi:hypothetical protein